MMFMMLMMMITIMVIISLIMMILLGYEKYELKISGYFLYLPILIYHDLTIGINCGQPLVGYHDMLIMFYCSFSIKVM